MTAVKQNQLSFPAGRLAFPGNTIGISGIMVLSILKPLPVQRAGVPSRAAMH